MKEKEKQSKNLKIINQKLILNMLINTEEF